jgi:release factor glutamine methyltransferase
MLDHPTAPKTTAGTCVFMGVELEIAPGALVPRAETELLGRTALALVADTPAPVVVDMCCGSGNLACAIAHARPDAKVWAADLTDETVALADRNAERLGLSPRLRVCQGDLFSGLRDKGLEGAVDIVVCNPPYISTGRLEGMLSHLLDEEPREAFDGGPYGISIHQRVMQEALAFLKTGGWLVFEFGHGQERQLELLLRRTKAYGDITFDRDEEGAPRVVAGRRTA